MNLRIFIERPVLSAVLSIVIVVVGIIGLFTLPVEQYPDIAPPTVQVYTAYDGASAETVQKSVIAPLEEAINGVEDMTYMTSSASNAGSAEITIYFKQGTNPDMAAVNVQNRVSKAAGQLPAEVTRVGVSVNKRQNGMLQIFTLHSPDSSLDENFLSNYININLKPAILRTGFTIETTLIRIRFLSETDVSNLFQTKYLTILSTANHDLSKFLGSHQSTAVFHGIRFSFLGILTNGACCSFNVL